MAEGRNFQTVAAFAEVVSEELVRQTQKYGRGQVLAKAVGVSPAFVSQIARGHRPLPLDRIDAFAQALGMRYEVRVEAGAPVS